MDSRPLYNESFSYSWVLHLKPSSFDASGDLHSRKFSIDSLDDGPFIEIDLLKMTPLLTATASTTTASPINTTTTAVSGNHHCHHSSNDFIFPTSQPLTLVPADRLFLDGHLLPLHLTHLEPELLDSSDSPHESTDGSDAPCGPRQRRTFLQRCRTSVHRFFRKLNRSQRRSGRKSQSSVSDVSTVDGTARKQRAEDGYSGLSSGHRCSVDDGMLLHPRKSFGVVDNLGVCFSCPTTPGHQSHV